MPNGMTWEMYSTYIENENNSACRLCAEASGYTREQASKCEDGELSCKDCPFENHK